MPCSVGALERLCNTPDLSSNTADRSGNILEGFRGAWSRCEPALERPAWRFLRSRGGSIPSEHRTERSPSGRSFVFQNRSATLSERFSVLPARSGLFHERSAAVASSFLRKTVGTRPTPNLATSMRPAASAFWSTRNRLTRFGE